MDEPKHEYMEEWDKMTAQVPASVVWNELRPFAKDALDRAFDRHGNNVLEWAATWVESSVCFDHCAETKKFAADMAMSIRAAKKVVEDSPAPTSREEGGREETAHVTPGDGGTGAH